MEQKERKESIRIFEGIIDGKIVIREVHEAFISLIDKRNSLQEKLTKRKTPIILFDRSSNDEEQTTEEIIQQISSIDKSLKHYLNGRDYLKIIPEKSGETYLLHLSVTMN